MKWLPDIDLNYDKQIQSLLCYRYTIGQSVACRRLNAFPVQSSQQPHRCAKSRRTILPLPGGEGRGEGERNINFQS
jgi:hypothetical protein